MYSSTSPPKNGNCDNGFQRQGSLRKVIPEHNKADLFINNQNSGELRKLYKVYRREYVILAEYKMIQAENIQGVYVIPSRESPLLWFGVIFVRNGPFKNGIFRFSIILDEDFPDSQHPKVFFQSNVYHPVINSESNELNLLGAFPSWSKNEQQLWQVIKYIQWIFDNVDSSFNHAVNQEAVETFKNNKQEFHSKAQEAVKHSTDHLYDDPPTEDNHYITFEQYNPQIHDRIRALMLSLASNDDSGKKLGHSWVLPGSLVPLGRPPSPP